MFNDSVFRIAFWVIFGGMLLLQALLAARAVRMGQCRPAAQPQDVREGWWIASLRVLRAIFLCASLILYAVNPAWQRLLSVPLPLWMRWFGILLGVLCLGLYTWSRITLGPEWSSCLHKRQAHQLVSSGPYARIRHPIYLAMILLTASLALTSANVLFVAFLGFTVLDLVLRIPKEEQMMIEVFGDEYRAYMQRTGKLLPKLWGYTSR